MRFGGQTKPQADDEAVSRASRAAAWFGFLSAVAIVGILLAGAAAQGQVRKPASFVPEDKLEKLDTTRFSRPTEITNKQVFGLWSHTISIIPRASSRRPSSHFTRRTTTATSGISASTPKNTTAASSSRRLPGYTASRTRAPVSR